MEVSAWLIIAIIMRWLVYCGLAVLVATPTLVVSPHNDQLSLRAYGFMAGLLASLASISYFLVQVGALSESGWLGMFDPMMVDIIWQSGHGDGLVYRLASIIMLLGLCVLPVRERYKRIKIVFYSIAVLLLGLSFSTTGHTASLATWTQIVLGAHVVIALWWIGSLLPLVRACQRLELHYLHQCMYNFGRVAIVLVAILCVLGLVLSLALIGSIELLFTTRYGQILLLKVIIVTGILLLAALHKWRLVPALLQQNEMQASCKLKSSIYSELFLGLVILLIAAVLSSAVGPV